MDEAQYLERIVSQGRQLLNCFAIAIRLQDGHTLDSYSLLSVWAMLFHDVSHIYGQREATDLYQLECVRAACDMTQQSRQIWSLRVAPYDLLILPLETPAGLLGVALCLDTKIGDKAALRHITTALAQQLEGSIYAMCLSGVSRWRVLIEQSTKEKTLEIQEQQALLSLVGHELRVPLAAIKGYAGLLQMCDYQDETDAKHSAVISKEQQRHYLEIILAQTRHLELLVKDLTDYTRLRLGHLVLQYRAVDIAALCHQVAQIIQDQIAPQLEAPHKIICRIEPDLPLVWADADRVQQILTNLLENAVKYSPAGGNIEILASLRPTMYPVDQTGSGQNHASQQARVIAIMICDQGIGIARQQQSALFRPFSRIHRAETQHVPGLGVGLYITRTLVEAMHGTITLESDTGKGTQITFTLPVVGEEHDANCKVYE